MEVVEQDQRRLFSRFEVAQGRIEVRRPRIEAGRGRGPPYVDRSPCADTSQGFADDPEMERCLHRLSPAYPDGEPRGLLSRLLEHARLAEPGFADHEDSLPLPSTRSFEHEGDGRHNPFPFEQGVRGES